MASSSVLYVGGNSLVIVSGLYDENAEAFENSATVEITLLDETSTTEVTGETWPITASYISNSNGRYHGIIDTDADLVVGTKYVVKVVIKVSAAIVSTFYIEVTAVEDRRS